MTTAKKPPHESILPVLAYINSRAINQADFIKEIDVSHGAFTNWKSRGVPQSRHAMIAAKIGMSTDEYLAQIGRPTGGPALRPDEQAVLDAYRKASPR